MKYVDIIIPLSYEAFRLRLRMLTKLATRMSRPAPLFYSTFIMNGKIYSKLKNNRLLLYSPGKRGKFKVPMTSIFRAKIEVMPSNSIRIIGKFGWPITFSTFIPLIVCIIISFIDYTNPAIVGVWAMTLCFYGWCGLLSCIGDIQGNKGNLMLIKWLQNIHLSDTDTGGFEKP